MKVQESLIKYYGNERGDDLTEFDHDTIHHSFILDEGINEVVAHGYYDVDSEAFSLQVQSALGTDESTEWYKLKKGGTEESNSNKVKDLTNRLLVRIEDTESLYKGFHSMIDYLDSHYERL